MSGLRILKGGQRKDNILKFLPQEERVCLFVKTAGKRHGTSFSTNVISSSSFSVFEVSKRCFPSYLVKAWGNFKYVLNVGLIHACPGKGLPSSLLLLGEDSILCLFTPDPQKQEVGFKVLLPQFRVEVYLKKGYCVTQSLFLKCIRPEPILENTNTRWVCFENHVDRLDL